MRACIVASSQTCHSLVKLCNRKQMIAVVAAAAPLLLLLLLLLLKVLLWHDMTVLQPCTIGSPMFGTSDFRCSCSAIC